jgi:hypothetical protein
MSLRGVEEERMGHGFAPYRMLSPLLPGFCRWAVFVFMINLASWKPDPKPLQVVLTNQQD